MNIIRIMLTIRVDGNNTNQNVASQPQTKRFDNKSLLPWLVSQCMTQSEELVFNVCISSRTSVINHDKCLLVK